MHELALMSGIFDIIRQHTGHLPEARVTKVTLVVGELTNAIPEALEAAFEVYCRDSNAEGADLVIRMVPLTAGCQDCGWQGKIEKHVFICPRCSSLNMDVKSGRELYVESLEVD